MTLVCSKSAMRGVEHQRLTPAQLVREEPRQPRVPALGQARADLDACSLLRVEVDVEVLGLEDLEVEVLVLDLVAAEVLRRRWRRRQDHDHG